MAAPEVGKAEERVQKVASLGKELGLEANELHDWLPQFLIPIPGIAHVSAPVMRKRSVLARMKDAVTSDFGMRG